jgi:mRNA-degrading endonuclease toxin of MazEF toxin-antitoxin module
LSAPKAADPVAQPGEVYWVNIPEEHTVGSEQYDNRPYVIVSVPDVNARGTVVGVPLTTVKDASKITFQPPYWILIPRKELAIDWGAHLKEADSFAKADQIRVLDGKRLGTKIGQVTLTALASIRLGVSHVVDLEP